MYDSHISHIREKLANIPDGFLEESFTILPGLTLTFQDYLTDQVSCLHDARPGFLEINYCRYGRAGWNMKDGTSLYLGSGDFCIHTQTLCSGSVMTLPGGHYEGLSVCMELSAFDRNLPELLTGTGITASSLSDKFCPDGTCFSLTASEHTEPIFSGFFDLEQPFQKPYFFLKSMELLLYLGRLLILPDTKKQGYPSEQVEIVRKIHEYLLEHMEQRITIDELSHQYLINPTTLKTVFKAVYGDSLAAHMKEHRMKCAAALLRQTDQSVSQIARTVGYESASRFSSAFRDTYQALPLEYRKKYQETNFS